MLALRIRFRQTANRRADVKRLLLTATLLTAGCTQASPMAPLAYLNTTPIPLVTRPYVRPAQFKLPHDPRFPLASPNPAHDNVWCGEHIGVCEHERAEAEAQEHTQARKEAVAVGHTPGCAVLFSSQALRENDSMIARCDHDDIAGIEWCNGRGCVHAPKVAYPTPGQLFAHCASTWQPGQTENCAAYLDPNSWQSRAVEDVVGQINSHN